MTIGRTASLLAGIPNTVPGYSVDRMCAGAMTAVTTLSSAIMAGAYARRPRRRRREHVPAPHGRGHLPEPRFLADRIVDLDALSMGATAENLHDRFPHLTKERADAFALGSQQKTAHAYAEGWIQPDLVPVAMRSAEQGWGLLTADEAPRPGTTLEGLSGLKTPFRPHGRVTAGNSSGLNDGATAALLAAESVADELGLQKKMRMVGFAFAGVAPEIMGVGPVRQHGEGALPCGPDHRRHRPVRGQRGIRRAGAGLPRPLRHRRRRPPGQSHGGAIAVGHPLRPAASG